MTLWLPLLAASFAAAQPALMSTAQGAPACDPSIQSCERQNKINACSTMDGRHPDQVFANLKKAAQEDPVAVEGRSLWQKMTFQKADTPPIVSVAEYLAEDSPAVATKDADGGPVIKVAGAAYDCTVDDDELAFVAGHELRHTIVKARVKECLNKGLKANGGNVNYLKYQDKRFKQFRLAQESDADAWGQWYAFKAGYDPRQAVDAIDHLGDLMEGMGASQADDNDHPKIEDRKRPLQAFANNANPPALDCPWKDE